MIRKSLKNERKSICLFALLFLMYALIYMTKNCYSAAMAGIVAQGIMTKTETGLIAAAFYIVYAPFQIVGGIAADRISPYKLLQLGTFGAAVCNLLVYFFSENYVAMLVIWSLNAAIQFGIWPAIFKILTSQLCVVHRARAVFYISFSSTVGLILSYALAAIITDWRVNFLLSAIVLFLVFAVFAVIYGGLSKHMSEDPVPVRSVISEKKSQKGAFGMILRSGIPLLLIVYVIHGLLSLGVKALAPVMLMESYPQLSAGTANALNIILIVAGPVGLILSRLPVFRRFSETTVMAIMLAAIVPMMIVVTAVGVVDLWLVIAALTLLSVAASLMGIYFSYVSKAFEAYGYSATLAGLFNCMAALGIVLANYVFASVADNFGWGVTTNAWLVLAIAALVLTALTIPIWKNFKKKMDM